MSGRGSAEGGRFSACPAAWARAWEEGGNSWREERRERGPRLSKAGHCVHSHQRRCELCYEPEAGSAGPGTPHASELSTTHNGRIYRWIRPDIPSLGIAQARARGSGSCPNVRQAGNEGENECRGCQGTAVVSGVISIPSSHTIRLSNIIDADPVDMSSWNIRAEAVAEYATRITAQQCGTGPENSTGWVGERQSEAAIQSLAGDESIVRRIAVQQAELNGRRDLVQSIEGQPQTQSDRMAEDCSPSEISAKRSQEQPSIPCLARCRGAFAWKGGGAKGNILGPRKIIFDRVQAGAA
ncbi:hypothetical protein BP6252_07669 [Coleophoma cylindrospora]|uniref:Uncharacterized protein n=1 Tax=Coleophoma cylindrospora TaxID=1849047 RepID=A0A3D8RAV7_9HELO|nr:hypothetical protein BP6252_07669 [Coleophoma cylindrospora]